MSITAVYFSPTENSKKSVLSMAKAISNDFNLIDITCIDDIKKEFFDNDFVIFGVPVYSGRVPFVAINRLKNFIGNSTPCIIVATYGNRHFDDALVEMEDLFIEQGFIIKGAAALVGRHTYGDIQVDRPNEDDFKQNAEFALKAFNSSGMKNKIFGNRPYRDGGYGGKFNPLTSDNCNSCGVCKENCPVGAIDDNFNVNSEKCIACFSCIRKCPVSAKNMNVPEYINFAKDFSEKLATRRENEYFL